MSEKTKHNAKGKKDFKVTASAEVLLEEKTPSIDEESLLELDTYRQKNVRDLRLEIKLKDSQGKQ